MKEFDKWLETKEIPSEFTKRGYSTQGYPWERGCDAGWRAALELVVKLMAEDQHAEDRHILSKIEQEVGGDDETS